MKIGLASETSTREEHNNYMSQLRQCGCDSMHCLAYQLVSSAIQVNEWCKCYTIVQPGAF